MRKPDKRQVREFVKANDIYPVVCGSVLDMDKGGALYTLSSGTTYKLYVDECRMLPDGYPKWAGAEQ